MSPPDRPDNAEPPKPAYRVPIGLPLRGEARKEGAIASVILHVTIIVLLLFPAFFARTVIQKIEQGAGGAGPAGGGGGGLTGEAGYHETLRFVRVTPQQVPTPTTLPPVPPPVIPPKIIPPPVVTPPAAAVPEQVAAPSPVMTVSSIPGVGTGNDGMAGAGPGSGGGVGSGIGTGRGTGSGPGTGGGMQTNYPPQPIEFFLPPLPPPPSVKGFKFIAEFDVDSTGRVLEFDFSKTRDNDYNRRIASILRSMRFRPGTRPDGTPLRMKAQVGYEF